MKTKSPRKKAMQWKLIALQTKALLNEALKPPQIVTLANGDIVIYSGTGGLPIRTISMESRACTMMYSAEALELLKFLTEHVSCHKTFAIRQEGANGIGIITTIQCGCSTEKKDITNYDLW